MPTARPLVDYPPEFFSLFEEAVHRAVEIHCEDENEARKLRGRLYAFREAVYEDMERAPLQALVAPLLTFRVSKNKLTIRRYYAGN